MESKGGERRITLGGDEGFDVAAFIEELRERKVTPHIAVQDHLTKTGKRRKTKIYGRTTCHPGYGVSQPCRKRIEEVFGWVKTSAGLGKTKFRGKWRVDASWFLDAASGIPGSMNPGEFHLQRRETTFFFRFPLPLSAPGRSC